MKFPPAAAFPCLSVTTVTFGCNEQSFKRHFKQQSNSSMVMPYNSYGQVHTWEGSDTAAAWPTAAGRGFSISEMLRCEKICILESMNQCVEGKGKVRKLLFTELEEVLHTCIIWAENKQ